MSIEFDDWAKGNSFKHEDDLPKERNIADGTKSPFC